MGLSDYLFVCLIGALPGPPAVIFEGANFQLFPISKLKCHHIDPNRDIAFHLYTRHNPIEPTLLRIDDDQALANSHFNFSEPTVFFFHAFFESSTAQPALFIRTAYTRRGDHNILLLNAPRLEAGPWYLTAAQNTRIVGEYTAKFIDYLVSRGLYLPSLHLTGLSLGAQMAGVCGQNVKSGRIRRITGMDPAGPLFTKWPNSLKLDADDAEFVDVIHTDAGIFGYPSQIGHADFWPNRGLAPQPGCNLKEVKRRNPDAVLEYAFCSHWKSYQYFAESIVDPNAFYGAVNCDSWGDYEKGVCNEDTSFVTQMGLYVDTRTISHKQKETSLHYSDNGLSSPRVTLYGGGLLLFLPASGTLCYSDEFRRDMATGLSLFCFLANMPGPPSIRFQNMTLQLWSVNKRICPEFDPLRDTIFHLYTRKNPKISQIIFLDDDESLTRSNIDFSLETIIFFHGYLESHENDDGQSVKNAYLEVGDYNVILVQNERLLAGPDYITAAYNCQPIARYCGRFIDYLVSRGMWLSKLHVIGLSLGGQIAGMTGQYVKSGRLPRITAFDPAGPLFNFVKENERIDPSDADFVDVIFTSSGLWGMKYSVGDVNYWPNGGGKKQPGCSIPEIINRYGIYIPWLVFCSHFRSYQLYVETLRSPYLFPSHKCDSYATFKLGYCKNTPVSYLGVAADPKDKGDFYLDTGLIGIYNG
ncbi:uncharacterized protein LOC132700864 [Cylas formicarius]|uniref:uncharacterized protein LOC132700864 n=1 Tax=Cylas formicarius TaxID=197179 RepID=UPI002958942B|nr:uncharacterized protein LOC132700864 [Cylas formicarius]